MGNDIARQFGHLDDDAAAERIATHIEKFWDPRMIERLSVLIRERHPEADPLLVSTVTALILDDVDRAELSKPSGG
jgi:formate dehydrogenase subunit delta